MTGAGTCVPGTGIGALIGAGAGAGHRGIDTGMGTLTDETETVPRDIIAEVTVTDDLAGEVTIGIATVAGTEPVSYTHLTLPTKA